MDAQKRKIQNMENGCFFKIEMKIAVACCKDGSEAAINITGSTGIALIRKYREPIFFRAENREKSVFVIGILSLIDGHQSENCARGKK